MKRIGALLSLAISVFVFAVATPLSTPALAQAPIKVGVIGPFKLTPGRDIQEAAELAVEEINAAGGVLGRKLRIDLRRD